jgi:hypothetical protein
MRAELLINGPKGFSSAEVEVRDDGAIESWSAEAALAHALNLYNELPEPSKENNHAEVS